MMKKLYKYIFVFRHIKFFMSFSMFFISLSFTSPVFASSANTGTGDNYSTHASPSSTPPAPYIRLSGSYNKWPKRFNTGVKNFKSAKLDDAQKDFKSVLKNSNDTELKLKSLFNLANIDAKQGSIEDAKKKYQNLIKTCSELSFWNKLFYSNLCSNITARAKQNLKQLEQLKKQKNKNDKNKKQDKNKKNNNKQKQDKQNKEKQNSDKKNDKQNEKNKEKQENKDKQSETKNKDKNNKKDKQNDKKNENIDKNKDNKKNNQSKQDKKQKKAEDKKQNIDNKEQDKQDKRDQKQSIKQKDQSTTSTKNKQKIKKFYTKDLQYKVIERAQKYDIKLQKEVLKKMLKNKKGTSDPRMSW